MYILNPGDVSDKKDLIKVNGVVAHYLIYVSKLSPYGQTDSKDSFYFLRNEETNKAIKEIPFYYKILMMDFKGGEKS